MTPASDKAVILLSGGIDSAVCLWYARHKEWRTYTITYNYHLHNPHELAAAQKLAEAAGVTEHRTVDLPFLRELEDTALPANHPLQAIIAQVPGAYVPARNTVFYAVAASWAEVLGAKWIVGGHGRMDHAGFPDSTPQYFARFNQLLQVRTWIARQHRVRIITPLAKLDKTGILKLGVKLGVPFELTWSCYRRGERHCGVCRACKQRKRAFAKLHLRDPAQYETNDERT